MPLSKSSLEPYLQGCLDKFCGIYAIINALQELDRAPFSHRKATMYFNQMVRELERQKKLALTATSGMSRATLLQLLTHTLHCSRSDRKRRVSYGRPYARNRKADIRDLAASLNADKGCGCAIVRILGKGQNHWTVIKGIERGWVKISDSDECGNFRLSDIRFGDRPPNRGYCIPAADVLLLGAIER